MRTALDLAAAAIALLSFVLFGSVIKEDASARMASAAKQPTAPKAPLDSGTVDSTKAEEAEPSSSPSPGTSPTTSRGESASEPSPDSNGVSPVKGDRIWNPEKEGPGPPPVGWPVCPIEFNEDLVNGQPYITQGPARTEFYWEITEDCSLTVSIVPGKGDPFDEAKRKSEQHARRPGSDYQEIWLERESLYGSPCVRWEYMEHVDASDFHYLVYYFHREDDWVVMSFKGYKDDWIKVSPTLFRVRESGHFRFHGE